MFSRERKQSKKISSVIIGLIPLRDSVISEVPAWVSAAQQRVADAGTVSSKERKFRNVCYDCKTHGHKWMQDIVLRNAPNTSFLSDSSIAQRAFPKRCKKCRSRHKRWSNALKVFVKLDELRMNEEIEYLRFVTKTRKDWVIWIPWFLDLPGHMNALKIKCNKIARTWRERNTWWNSKNPLGQVWPECKVTGVGKIIDGRLVMGYQLQFHQHMILVSEFLDNQPVTMGDGILGKKVVIDDSEFYKEWGGIVDVRAVKDWKNNWYIVKGEARRGCGKKMCVNYLSKYITKAKGWNSQKIGKW